MSQSEQYDLEMKDGPTCQIHIRLPMPGDSKRLTDTLSKFAAAHDIPISAVRGIDRSGRESPRMYSTKDILIAPFMADFPPVPQQEQYGQIRIYVLRRSYPIQSFLTLANDFHSTFQREFGDLVDIWEEPNDGTNDLKP